MKIIFSETTVVWHKKTGLPLHNAIVWLDTRTADLAKESIHRTASKYVKILDSTVFGQNHSELFPLFFTKNQGSYREV